MTLNADGQADREGARVAPISIVFYGANGILVMEYGTVHRFLLGDRGSWAYVKYRTTPTVTVHAPNDGVRRLYDLGAFDE